MSDSFECVGVQLVRRLQELEDSGGVMGTGGAPSARIHITIKPGLPNSIRWDMVRGID
jgi:hypothetical protein